MHGARRPFMRRLVWTAGIALGIAVAGCGTKYEGGCRLPDDTCLEWYTDSDNADTSGYAAECRAASGGDFSTASCASASRVGTCLYDSLLNGRRQIYYSPTWTTESARAACDAARGTSGSFVAN